MNITKYSCLITIKGQNYLFNTFNSSLIEIDHDSIKKINNNEHQDILPLLSSDEQTLLMSEGFLTGPDDDICKERSLRMGYHQSKYSPASKIKLDIGVTDKCNFACPYCFEKGNKSATLPKDNHFTHAELLYEIGKYIAEHAQKGTTDIEIVWYGGEPTLELDFICFANDKLSQDAIRCGLKYSNILVTNGYKLDINHIQKLQKQNVKYIQVTIDGLKETHNKRRSPSPDVDSFEIILSNIDNLLSHSIETVIRINIDSTNYSEAHELLDYLSRRYPKNVIGRLLFVNFGRVFGSNTSFSHLEYEEIYHDLFLHAVELGFIEPEFEAHDVGAFCNAETESNSIVIDFMGYQYKCWNNIFDRPMAIGNIFSNKSPISDNSQSTRLLYMEGLSLDTINDGQCLSCELLKYCGGLCPYNRKLILERKEENIYGNKLCKQIVKQRIATYIEAYLDKLAKND